MIAKSPIEKKFEIENPDLLYFLFTFVNFKDLNSLKLVSKLFLKSYYAFILNINPKLRFFPGVLLEDNSLFIKKCKEIMIAACLGEMEHLDIILAEFQTKLEQIKVPLSGVETNSCYEYEISLLHSAIKNIHWPNGAAILRLLRFYKEHELEQIVLNMEAYAFAIEGNLHALNQTNTLSISYFNKPVSNMDYLTLIYSIFKGDYEWLQKGLQDPLIYPCGYKNFGLVKEYSLTTFGLANIPLLQIIQKQDLDFLKFFCQQFRELPFAGTKKLVRQDKGQPLALNWLNQSTDRYGRTALHYAVSLGDLEMVQLLVHWGMDLSQKDSKNNRAIDYARANKQEKIISYLESIQNDLLDTENNDSLALNKLGF